MNIEAGQCAETKRLMAGVWSRKERDVWEKISSGQIT